jgi:hypothetical protein
MKINNTDAILLSFDTKGDWIRENGEAHSHYIQIVNSLTGKQLFILDGDRYFSDRLKNSFAPVSPEITSVAPVLLDLTKESPISAATKAENAFVKFLNKLFYETGLNPIYTIEDDFFMPNIRELYKREIVPGHILMACGLMKQMAWDNEYRESKEFKNVLLELIKQLSKILVDLRNSDE